MTKRLNLTGKKFGKLIAVYIQPIINGQTLTMAQWAEKMNINLGSIHSRINAYKWSTEKALTTPIKQTNRWPLAKVLKIKPKTS